MAMAFPCASPSNGCSEDGQRLGWGRIKNGFPKSPARGFSLGVLGLGEERGKDGNNAPISVLLYLILFTVQHMGSAQRYIARLMFNAFTRCVWSVCLSFKMFRFRARGRVGARFGETR